MGKNQGQKTSYQNQAYVTITGRKHFFIQKNESMIFNSFRNKCPSYVWV